MKSPIRSILFVWVLLLAGVASLVHANELTRTVATRDLTVRYGVMPASKSAAPAEGTSTPSANGPDLYIVTIALFDRSTGDRIEDATVSATVKGPRSEASHRHAKPATQPLEPMRADHSVTYGGTFDMRWTGIYHIELHVTRKGQTRAETVRLDYDQQF